MKNGWRMIGISMLALFFVLGSLSTVPAADDKVRAKIGIQVKSGERVKRAKARDRLKGGDLLRIYVHPEVSSYVYVVHTDKKTVSLLNMTEQKIQSSTLVLPSVQDFYQVDGTSSVESFTIVCSPNEIPALSGLSGTEVAYEKWAEIRDGLEQKSKIALTQEDETPFAIAGNVRGGIGPGSGDPFVKKLQIFSGKNLLVKKYEFKVKK